MAQTPNQDLLALTKHTFPITEEDNSHPDEIISSLVVLKTGRDRIYCLKCCVCDEVVKLRQPVICQFLDTWDRTIPGGRGAVTKLRDHCAANHATEFAWRVLPSGGTGVVSNESQSQAVDDMDELIRYSLESAASKEKIDCVNRTSSTAGWTTERLKFNLFLFIVKRFMIAKCIIKFGCKELVRSKKLFRGLDMRVVREEAKGHVDNMSREMSNQVALYSNEIFDDAKRDRYMNRLQLCYVERRRWRRLLTECKSAENIFGGS